MVDTTALVRAGIRLFAHVHINRRLDSSTCRLERTAYRQLPLWLWRQEDATHPSLAAGILSVSRTACRWVMLWPVVIQAFISPAGC